MEMLFNKVESSALKLPERQRARLAGRLIESLDKSSEIDIDQTWLEEIERRNRQLESGEAELIPASEVLQKARKLLS